MVNAFDRARLAANDVVGDLAEFDDLSNEVAHATGITKPVSENSNGFVDHTQDPEAIPQKMAGTQVTDVVEDEMLEDLVVDAEIIEEVVIEEVIIDEVVETLFEKNYALCKVLDFRLHY